MFSDGLNLLATCATDYSLQLIVAILKNNKEELEGLFEKLEKNSKRDVYINCESSGWTPLTVAVLKSDLSTVKRLKILGAELDKEVSRGYTPLMVAVDRGRKDMIEYLVSQGVDLNKKDKKGITALSIAIARDRMDIIWHLMEKGAKLDEGIIKGYNLLMKAINHNHEKMVRHLVEHGVKVNLEDESGKKLVAQAYKSGNTAIGDYLIDVGVKKVKEQPEEKLKEIYKRSKQVYKISDVQLKQQLCERLMNNVKDRMYDVLGKDKTIEQQTAGVKRTREEYYTEENKVTKMYRENLGNGVERTKHESNIKI